MKLQASTLAVLVALFAGSDRAFAQTTERVSVDSAGQEGDQASNIYPGSISADGRYVAFTSGARNLVAGDTNNRLDVFVRDRLTGTTERVSVDSTGAQANESSFWSSISADGRWVAFISAATNLIAGGTTPGQVFVHDRQSGTTEMVSVDSAGVEGNDGCLCTSISADGQFVAFASWATNLVPGDTYGYSDCFVRDRRSGTTERVSVTSNGLEGYGDSAGVTISADGRFVAFGSRAFNLVLGDTNGTWDIFEHDRESCTTIRVSVDSNGVQGNLSSFGHGDPRYDPAISADGRFVAFYSVASNLVPNDTHDWGDVFVHDRVSGTTERVSVSSAGVEGTGYSSSPWISSDGRYVAFQSDGSNLVAGDTNGFQDIFVHDRLSGTTERESLDGAGLQGDFNSWLPSISADGRFVAFWSWASNLVAGDTNDYPDIFVRDRGAPPLVSFCMPGQGLTIACPCSNPPAGTDRGCENSSATGGASISASGNASLAADTLVFATAAETPTATSIVVQGSGASFSGFAFGQGVRCVTDTLKRLYIKSAAGGSISAPSGSDLSVSVRSAALGDVISAGQHRFYMVTYRDPIVLGGCAATSTFNATDAVDAPWQP